MKFRPASILLLMIILSVSFTTIAYQATPVRAWWATGHTIIATHAVEFLPKPWSSFFNYYGLTVNESALYPDGVYAAMDPNEGPRHFIDLEVWNPSKPETGTLPFAVAQYTAEMTQAIKFGDWNLMLKDAGRLAHYVGDIHQPYHSTVNYDPRNKQGSGLHGVLDASLETHVNEFKLLSPSDVGQLQPVANVTAFMFYIAWQSHSFLPTINHTLIDEGKSWSPELTRIIENRTNTAIVSVARIWYTAIVNAGQQPPSIPSPNKLRITIASPPQQASPDKALTVSFMVSDSLGIRTILNPKASIANVPQQVYNDQGLETPFGKYIVIAQPDTLRSFAGSSLTLDIVADQAGFERATAQVQVQVSPAQTTTTAAASAFLPVEIVNIVLLIVAIAILGVVVRFALRRFTKARQGCGFLPVSAHRLLHSQPVRLLFDAVSGLCRGFCFLIDI